MENQQEPVGLLSVTGAAKLKGFEELTEKEQIQRLREELMSARYIYRRVRELEKEINKLKQHQHGLNGEVLVSALYRDDSGELGSYDRLK